jgi:hypothetical protein
LPSPVETAADLQVRTTIARPRLGHGVILDEPVVWRRVLAAIGQQTAARDGRVVDPIEDDGAR